MNVRIHRLVADGKSTCRNALNSRRTGIGRNDLALTRQPLEITAVMRIVRVFFDPAESFLGQLECPGISGRLISRCRAIKYKAYSVKMLAVGIAGRDLPFIIQTPKETAILPVPEHVD